MPLSGGVIFVNLVGGGDGLGDRDMCGCSLLMCRSRCVAVTNT